MATKAKTLVAAVLATVIGAAAVTVTAAESGAKDGAPAADVKEAGSPLDFAVKDIDGKETDLSRFKGQVVMIVNVASKCGYTPQYKALEAMYEQYKEKGFVIVGFPANNFKFQEPGTNAEIKAFCTGKYNVTFPMMSKVSVKGEDKAAVYKFLTEDPTAGGFGGDIKWNFTKFLVGRDGKVVARFEPKVKPDDAEVKDAVEKAIATADAKSPA
jgi:glutathione peroxidase